MIQFSEIEYKNFGKCVKMTDGRTEILVTVDVGPRIISYRLCEDSNIFAEFDVDFKKPTNEVFGVFGDLGVFNNFGGHRLWVAPEESPRTNFPDNHPCEYSVDGDVLYVKQMPQPYTDVQLEMEIFYDECGDVVVKHYVTNIGAFEKEIAPWSISLMKKGGTVIVPMVQYGPKLLPNRRFSFWTYSDLSDDRFNMGKKYVTLTQKNKAAFKFGCECRDGYAIYVNEGIAFTKYFDFEEGECYPDNGCNFESYTNCDFLEVESIAPLNVLERGDRVCHEEIWHLEKCNITSFDDEAIDGLVNKVIK